MEESVLGREDATYKVTTIDFADGSDLRVNWDGRYEVSGLYGTNPVLIYCPNGRKIIIPWHRIDQIHHYEPTEDDE